MLKIITGAVVSVVSVNLQSSLYPTQTAFFHSVPKVCLSFPTYLSLRVCYVLCAIPNPDLHPSWVRSAHCCRSCSGIIHVGLLMILSSAMAMSWRSCSTTTVRLHDYWLHYTITFQLFKKHLKCYPFYNYVFRDCFTFTLLWTKFGIWHDNDGIWLICDGV